MQWYWINESDIGMYHEDRILLHDSRKEAAEKRQYTVAYLGGGAYEVRRPGGATHRVELCRWYGYLFGGCDCYDFSTYGFSRNRACQHIWAAVLTQDIGVC